MPQLCVFASESKLIASLRQRRTEAAAVRFYSERIATIEEVVRTAVGSNTYRAFGNLPVRPSTTFRNWAARYVRRRMPPLNSRLDQRKYSAYVHDATLALSKHWRNATDSEMGYGRGAKLLNLVLKKLACLASLSENERRNLILLQHVPLDSYTIVGIKAVAPDLAIPRSATMKYIKTREQYVTFQERITAIAAKAQVPPIYYDILAWDRGHDGE